MQAADSGLSFQRLDVYRCAIELLAFVSTTEFPRGFAHLADQLRRAALSVPLNIAEAARRTGAADAARHSPFARGSAMEQVLSILEEERQARGIELVSRIVAMSTKLCR